ncbi:choice-of-anchor J domain-containing protein [Flavobacterium sp.]|jgi:hypothetical protein|uniref:choice-of-anchor J domain-containing protein n=1 Tax=Flavobacterium sp. TaxID=239 RepID=UPI0037BF59AD
MKKTALYTFLVIAGLTTLTNCTSDNDVENARVKTTLFVENFTDNTDGTILNTTGWTNFAQVGTKKFTEEVYSGNGYAEFTSYGSSQASNIAWLISPGFDMNKQDGEKLVFQAAHAYLTSVDNSLELMVSTDYDGNIANFNQSNWLSLPVTTPTPSNDFYEYVNSGEVDLSKYNGTLYFAFKVKGSGTNTALDATYQIDNIRLYY